MFAVLILLLLAPSVGPLNELMEVYATPSKGRGRLVVACDMRSDTCSDGRQITTVRATSVPCETSPGVWEMVPEDTGCYSVRGLESWAATTSYLSYGAELDRSPWGSIRGGTLERVSDGWRVSNDPAQANSGWTYFGGPAVEGTTLTVACRVRADVPTTVRLVPVSGAPAPCPIHTVTPEWTTVSCTRTAVSSDNERVHIWPGVGQSGPASVIVAGCWLTRTDTPGRPCWGGEAPVTCAADRHTISTEGWPTEAGEISITWELAEACPPGVACVVFDGRLSGADTANPFYVWISVTGNVLISIYNSSFASIGQQPAPGVPTTVTARRRDGVLEIYRDGTLVTAKAADPFVWNSEANLGRRYLDAAFRPLNGSIRSLRVRSFE